VVVLDGCTGGNVVFTGKAVEIIFKLVVASSDVVVTAELWVLANCEVTGVVGTSVVEGASVVVASGGVGTLVVRPVVLTTPLVTTGDVVDGTGPVLPG